MCMAITATCVLVMKREKGQAGEKRQEKGLYKSHNKSWCEKRRGINRQFAQGNEEHIAQDYEGKNYNLLNESKALYGRHV